MSNQVKKIIWIEDLPDFNPEIQEFLDSEVNKGKIEVVQVENLRKLKQHLDKNPKVDGFIVDIMLVGVHSLTNLDPALGKIKTDYGYKAGEQLYRYYLRDQEKLLGKNNLSNYPYLDTPVLIISSQDQEKLDTLENDFQSSKLDKNLTLVSKQPDFEQARMILRNWLKNLIA